MHVRTGVQMFGPTGFRQATPADRVLGGLGTTRRRPSYRNTYKPPMLASSKSRLGGFWEDLQFSVSTAAAGGGALLLAGILPSPAKTFVQIAGVGLLAFAIINIAGGEAEARDEPDSRQEIPIADPVDFQAVSAAILEPLRNTDIPLGFLSSDYDVKVEWFNPSDTEIEIPFQVRVEETPIQRTIGEKFRGIAHSGVVKLPPNKRVIVEMEIPLLNREWGAAATVVNFVLNKVGRRGLDEVAQTSFTVYPNAVQHYLNPFGLF